MKKAIQFIIKTWFIWIGLFVFIESALMSRSENGNNPRKWSARRIIHYDDTDYVVITRIDTTYYSPPEPKERP